MGVSLLAGLMSGIGAAVQGLSFWAAFAVTAGLSVVSRALSPRPKAGGNLGGQTVTTREPAHSRKIVYGRSRIGGNIVYLESSGDDNKYLWLVIAVAGHEIDAYEEVWFNDKKIWDGGSYVSDWGSYVDIGFYKGDQTTADSELVAASSKWTSDHKLLDTAYMVVKLTYDRDQFSQGLPNISTVIRGKKVWHPNHSSPVWSQNPALCLRDYLTDTKYGLGESASNIASINTALGVCDEPVDLAAGGTQLRYTLNGVVDTANTVGDNIEQMLGAMVGRLLYVGGKFEIHAGKYVAPTITVDESMVVGEISVQTKQSRRNAYNAVKGVFLSEDDNYVLADYPAQISSSYATSDGEPLYLDMTLPFTTNHFRAQRIAKLALLRSRQQEAITIPCNLSALKFKIGDNIFVTNSRLGYSSKIFEVVGYSLDLIQGGSIVVNVDAVETASSIWDWTTSDEEVFLGAGEVDLYDGSVAVAPASLTVTPQGFIASDGTYTTSFNVSFPASVDAFVKHYVLEWKKQSDGSYFDVIIDQSPAQITGLETGSAYDVRIKAVNDSEVSSSYTTATQTIAADSSAPNAPSAVSASGEFEQITINWTNPTVADFSHVDVYRSTSSSGTYTLIGTSAGTNFTDTNLAVGVTRYYKLKAVDYTGNPSGYSSIVNATTTQVPVGGIADDAVDTDQIADLAVETDQIDDDAVTIAKVAASLQSTNYVSGSAGWKIQKSGVVEFEEATIRGEIVANTGEIGGFDIANTYLKDAANTMGLSSVASSADDVRFWAGNTFANRASAPFFVTKSGALKATEVTVSGTAPQISIGTNSSDTITLSTASDHRMWVGSSTPESAKFKIHKDGTLTAKGMHLQDGSASAYFGADGFTDLAYSQIATNIQSRVNVFETSGNYNLTGTGLNALKVNLTTSSSLTITVKTSNLFSGLSTGSVTGGSAASVADAIADIPDNFTLALQKSTTSGTSGFSDLVTQTFTKVTSGSTSSTTYLVESTAYVPPGTTNFATQAEVNITNYASVSNLNADGNRVLENTSTYATGAVYFRVLLSTTDTSYDSTLNNIMNNWPRVLSIKDNGATGFTVVNDDPNNREITQAAGTGDITSVVAGTNLSGGGTSGGVTLNLASSISLSNVTLDGYLRGPSTFTIDPAAYGDDTGTLVIAGNLQVDGTTTTINSTTVNIEDLNVQLASDAANASAANGAGITVGGANAELKYIAVGDKWTVNKTFDVAGSIIVSGAVDGRDIATDGTKLDGIEASADVTDATNVTAAGALMDSELTSIASVKALNQGVATTDSPTFAAVTVNGTATMDGLSVDGNVALSGDITSTNTIDIAANGFGRGINLKRGNGAVNGLSLSSGGDISFYEDTGTTAKFFWDASAEFLGIGTSSPVRNVSVVGSANAVMSFHNSTTGSTINDGLFIGNDANQAYLYNYEATPIVFATSNTERMRIDSSGRVGIGTSSPFTGIDLRGTSATAGNTIQIVGNSVSTLLLGQDDDGGVIRGQGGNNALKFYTGGTGDSAANASGTERMRIDSSGTLLVGVTTNSSSIAGVTAGNSGLITACRSSNYSGIFNRLSTDGDIAVFRKDGTTVGSLGTAGGDFIVNAQSLGVLQVGGVSKYGWTGSLFYPTNNNTSDLGTSSFRFKNLYLSGAISSGAITSNGNLTIKGDNGFNASNETASLYLGDTNSEIRSTYNGGTKFFLNGTDRMELEGSTGNLNLKTGVFKVNGTTVIDASRNVTATGLTVTKTTQTDIASFVNNNGSIVLGHYSGGSQIDLGSNIAFRIRQGSAIPLSINTSGNATFGGTINSGGYQVNGTTVIDASRNLTNIGTISSGAITSSGTVTADKVSSQKLTSGNGGLRIHSSGTKIFAITEANAVNSGAMDLGASDAKFKNLYLSGTISSGAITSSGTISTGSGTNGALALTDLYSPSTGDHLANIGWLRSSGGTYLGYGAKQSGSATWVSTYDNFSGKRNYVAFDEDSVKMVFAPAQQTAVGSAITGLTERFKFDLNSGVFQVGGTTVIDSSRNLTNIGTISSGAITSSGNITAFSDERLKSNVKTLDGKKVLEMRGVSFTKDGEDGSGVIAQELEKVAPELVLDGEEYKSVAYGNLVGYLIENAKEQQKEIDELKSLVKQLLEK